MRISDWSSDVCSSDLDDARVAIRIIAYFAMRDDFKVLGGISRQDVQGAAGRVAAEQRALRTTEHFDAFKIVEIGHALRRTGDINAVDIDADRSEEHTSELQSLMRISYAVFCLKKQKQIRTLHIVDNKLLQI